MRRSIRTRGLKLRRVTNCSRRFGRITLQFGRTPLRLLKVTIGDKKFHFVNVSEQSTLSEMTDIRDFARSSSQEVRVLQHAVLA